MLNRQKDGQNGQKNAREKQIICWRYERPKKRKLHDILTAII